MSYRKKNEQIFLRSPFVCWSMNADIVRRLFFGSTQNIDNKGELKVNMLVYIQKKEEKENICWSLAFQKKEKTTNSL
jgi:hypothetical protein